MAHTGSIDSVDSEVDERGGRTFELSERIVRQSPSFGDKSKYVFSTSPSFDSKLRKKSRVEVIDEEDSQDEIPVSEIFELTSSVKDEKQSTLTLVAFCKLSILALLVVDVVIALVFLYENSRDPKIVDPVYSADETYEKSDLVNAYYTVLIASMATFALSLLTALAMFSILKKRFYMLVAAGIKGFEILLDIVNGLFKIKSLDSGVALLAAGTACRVALTILLLSLYFYYTRRYAQKEEQDELVIVTPPQTGRKESIVRNRLKIKDLSPVEVQNGIYEMIRWTKFCNVRKFMYSKMNRGRVYFSFVLFFFSTVCLISFVFEMHGMVRVSTKGSFFDGDQIKAMNDPKGAWKSVFDSSPLTQPSKVVLVVLDGLRDDYIRSPLNNFHDFVESPNFAKDAFVTTLDVSLPTMSVPAWLEILTGAPPEITGIRGNILIPETDFDSLFAQARSYNVTRGLTGLPVFADLIRSQLPVLYGDGTVATKGGRTGDPEDWKRAEVATDAIRSGDYDFFLVHLDDIDQQGHNFGVEKRWNKDDTYNGAINNKTVILSNMLNVIDDNTVLIITSDHGHVGNGGHGGAVPEITRVPFIFYKRNSNLRDKLSNVDPIYSFDILEDKRDPAYFEEPHKLADICTSVSALLGIPIPRQSFGRFLRPIYHLLDDTTIRKYYIDLYHQKKLLITNFLINTDYDVKKNDLFSESTSPDDLNLVEIKNEVNKMMRIYNLERVSFHSREIGASMGVSAIFSIGFMAGIIITIQSSTFCDIKAAFSRTDAPHKIENRRAMKYSLLMVTIFYGLSIGTFVISSYIVGYITNSNYSHLVWDSTHLHAEMPILRFFLFSLIPPLLVEYAITRFTWFYFSSWFSNFKKTTESKWKRALIFILSFHKVSSIDKVDWSMIYLVKHYMLLFTLLSLIILFILQGTYTFIVPNVIRMSFVDAPIWVLQFRLLTCQLMSFPLLFGNIWFLNSEWPMFDKLQSTYDSIFLLQLVKMKDEDDKKYKEDMLVEYCISVMESNDNVIKSTTNPAAFLIGSKLVQNLSDPIELFDTRSMFRE